MKMLGTHFKSCRNDDRNVNVLVSVVFFTLVLPFSCLIFMNFFHEFNIALNNNIATPFDHSKTLTALLST